MSAQTGFFNGENIFAKIGKAPMLDLGDKRRTSHSRRRRYSSKSKRSSHKKRSYKRRYKRSYKRYY
jgi:hypothetical protein